MATTEQKKRLLKAKIAVALQDELGRVPREEEINQVFLMARVMYKRRFSQFASHASCNHEDACGLQQGLDDETEPVIT